MIILQVHSRINISCGTVSIYICIRISLSTMDLFVTTSGMKQLAVYGFWVNMKF